LAGPAGPPGSTGPKGDPGAAGAKGDPGPAGLRLVVGDNVACGQDEVLVSLVCPSGAPDGGRCAAGGSATGLCMRK
jgi:hypothetical protein